MSNFLVAKAMKEMLGSKEDTKILSPGLTPTFSISLVPPLSRGIPKVIKSLCLNPGVLEIPIENVERKSFWFAIPILTSRRLSASYKRTGSTTPLVRVVLIDASLPTSARAAAGVVNVVTAENGDV